MESMVAKSIFLTKGVGRHKEKLASFEEALTRKLQLALVLAVKAMHNFVPHFFNSFSVL